MNALVLLARPWYWLPTIATGIAGAISVNKENHHQPLQFVLLILVLGPGVSAFAEIFNDMCDRARDKHANVKALWGIPVTGGTGVLTGNTPPMMLAKGGICCSLLIAIGASAALGNQVILATIFGLLLAACYSGPLIRLKSRGALGLLVQALGYGPVAFYIGESSVANVTLSHNLDISLLIGAWVATMGATADLLDRRDDLKTNSRTLMVRLGESLSTAFVVGGALLVLVVAILLVVTDHGRIGLLMSATICFYVTASFMIIRSTENPPPIIHLFTVLSEVSFPISLVWFL